MFKKVLKDTFDKNADSERFGSSNNEITSYLITRGIPAFALAFVIIMTGFHPWLALVVMLVVLIISNSMVSRIVEVLRLKELMSLVGKKDEAQGEVAATPSEAGPVPPKEPTPPPTPTAFSESLKEEDKINLKED